MQSRTSQSGFSTLEVVIAAATLSIAVVGLALMYGTGQALIVSEGDNRVALSLAHQRLEQLRAAGFANAAVTDASTADPPDSIVETLETADPVQNPRYRRTTSIVCVNPADYTARVACPAPETTKLLTVTVEKLENTASAAALDPKTRAVTLQSVLVSR